MIEAGFFGGLFNWVTDPVDSSILVIFLFGISWATKKWLLPFLNTGIRKKLAEYTLLIADEVTDQLVVKYPDKKVWQYLDEAVDKIMKVCGVKKEVAVRAAEAAFGRKGKKKLEQ